MLKKPFYYTIDDKVKEIEKLKSSEVKEEKDKPLSSKKMLSIVGGNIRSIRKSQRTTISRLAEMAKISEKYLQGVEVGKRNISITNLYKIAKTLKVSLDVFFIENKDNVNERILFIESRLKDYTKEQLVYIETLIEDIKSIVDRSFVVDDEVEIKKRLIVEDKLKKNNKDIL